LCKNQNGNKCFYLKKKNLLPSSIIVKILYVLDQVVTTKKNRDLLRDNKKREVITFSVPIPFNEIKTDVIISTSDSSDLSKEEIIRQAFKFHSNGNVRDAIKYYQLFFKQGFSDPQVFNNYGIILFNLGKLEDAEIILRKAIKLRPDFAQSYLNLGRILKDLGKIKESELATIKAIKLRPDYAEAYYNLGNTYRTTGRLQKAKSMISKALTINPNLANAHFNLGSILKDLGKLSEAEESTRKAIELNPNNENYYFNLGAILSDLGRLKQAKKSWEKAIYLNPKFENAIFELAQRLYLDGDYRSVIKYVSNLTSDRFRILYLSSLLSIDDEERFYQIYEQMLTNNIYNSEVGGIIEHANVIYNKNYNSLFCNKALDYIFIDKINESLLSNNHFNQLISYVKSDDIQVRSQNTLINGVQTSGNLFKLNYPFINSLKEAIEKKIQIYKNTFKESSQGFINNWPDDYELRSWMIAMKKGGFLKPHNHGYGWITGSFYLQVPKTKDNDESGSIAFTYQGPDFPVKGKEFLSKVQKLETRDLCIFPSSLFHQTIPFESSEERICFVFDLIKRNNNI